MDAQTWALGLLGQPYELGQRDCCLIACDWVDLNAGTTLASLYRGRYSTRAEALAVYRERPPSLLLAEHGLLAIDPRDVRAGDVLFSHCRDWPVPEGLPSVVLGAHGLTVDEQVGVVALPLRALRQHAAMAWRIEAG